MRTETGILLLIRVSTVFKRSVGDGACGSISFAVLSSSVVMVKATAEGTLRKRSISRWTSVDFVIIWIRQSLWESTAKHIRVKSASASMRGYGSELLAMEMISPFNFAASRCKR